MSLRSNYEYIRDWVNTWFLKKTDVDFDQYYTKNEVDAEVDSARVDTSLYMSKEEYQPEEEVVASALIDLDSRIKSITEDNANGFMGEDEEKVIALALTDLDGRVNASAPLNSPNLTGTPTAPTATSGTNTTQLATTAFVTNAIAEGVPILGITLNSVSGTLTNHVVNLPLTISSAGTGNIITGVSIDGTVITVTKSNLPFTANSGSTRPTLNSTDIGYVFLDTTLGKPIWWNGSAWIDATGATV